MAESKGNVLILNLGIEKKSQKSVLYIRDSQIQDAVIG